MQKHVLWNYVLIAILAPLLSLDCMRALASQAAVYPCQPTPAIEAALAKLDGPIDVEHTTTAERRARERALLQSLLAKYPDNQFIHSRYQEFFLSSLYADPAVLIERYKKLLSQHPNSPVYLDLYGDALAGVHTVKAEQEFKEALTIAPNFPWPHLDLAEQVYGKANFRDPAKFQANLQDFMNACPSTLEAFSLLGKVNDTTLLRASARRLRKLLAQKANAQNVGYYSTLWELEFRIASPGQSTAVKKQVAADLARLRALKLVKSTDWYETLAEGYKLVGDQAGQKWVQAQEGKNLPDALDTIMGISENWHNEHSAQGLAASPAKKKAYFDSLLAASDGWIKRWPDFSMGWYSRFEALTQMQDAPGSEIESAADRLLRTAPRNPDQLSIYPPAPLQVAKAYVKHGIRLESVPGLVGEAIKNYDRQNRRMAESDTVPPQYAALVKSQPEYVYWQGLTTLADAYVKMKQPLKTQEILVKMEDFLDQRKPGKSASAIERNGFLAWSKAYWNSMGQLAELENHKPDALAYYHSALHYLALLPAPFKRDDTTVARARKLWNAMGGTEEGWQAWISGPPAGSSERAVAASVWNTIDEPLPDFDLAGVQGKTWRLADIKGKVTFIDVWATWCGPCRAELPFVQKLYKQVKDGSNVRVLTLNDDENPGLAEQFMKAHHYDFPAALAYNYLNRIGPNMALPRNWIVDRNGVRRLQSLGFGQYGAAWIKEVLSGMAQVEK